MPESSPLKGPEICPEIVSKFSTSMFSKVANKGKVFNKAEKEYSRLE
jgi:hypothetical protein